MRKVNENLRSSLLRQLEELDESPLAKEIQLVEQTIKYVKKLVNVRDARNIETNDSGNITTNIDGSKLEDGITLLPKSQRQEKFYFPPRKAKEKHKTSQNGRKSSKSHIFKHDIGTLSYFEECGVCLNPILNYNIGNSTSN